MPLIDSPGNIVTATAANLLAPFNSFFEDPVEYRGPDFLEFVIQEITTTGLGAKYQLRGTQLPFQPFEFGGTQQLVKQYYAGNAEPTVQVLGAREDNVVLRGRFKAKGLRGGGLFSTAEMRQIPAILQEGIDELRQRGNLCKFSLGEWERWGFIESSNFKMKTLADIDYEINISILGASPPSQCKLIEDDFVTPDAENLALIQAALDFEAQAFNPPTLTLGLFDQLNEAIGAVASAVKLVTTFTDTLLSLGENAQKLANKGIGLVKHTQTEIHKFKAKLAALQLYKDTVLSAENLQSIADEAEKTSQAKYVLDLSSSTFVPPTITPAQKAAAVGGLAPSQTPLTQSQIDAAGTSGAEEYAFQGTTAQKAASSQSTGQSLEATLSKMLAAFEKIAQMTPKARHLVQGGDTLLKLSIKYYETPNNWEDIYNHNKLTTTTLVRGTVLEIPNL